MEETPPEDETPKERADRELIELLNELRIVLPGVTVLLAFLLAVPFANGWPKVTPFQRDVFVVAFLAAAVAVAFLTAPSSYHRIRFRHGDKERMVKVGNWQAIGPVPGAAPGRATNRSISERIAVSDGELVAGAGSMGCSLR